MKLEHQEVGTYSRGREEGEVPAEPSSLEDRTAEREPPRQIVQAGLGTTPDRGIIQSLWIEIPANCDLRCPYCFCATTKDRRDRKKANLAWNPRDPERYSPDLYIENILRPFAERINQWNAATPDERISLHNCPPENSSGTIRGAVAIPGAGEPFHPANRELTLALIEAAGKWGLHMTIFTTAHWIDGDLARELASSDVVLLVKYNSAKKAVQNTLVGQHKDGSFFDRREHGLAKLLQYGFNVPYGTPGDPRYQATRLGIVTSVMKDNLSELPNLLRFARRKNLVFDCDTILERGRGTQCTQIPSDDDTREAFYNLQRIDRDEFGKHWDISRSYIGTTCDRFRHHLYIDRTGRISPCVGSTDVILGNAKAGPEALYATWNMPLMRDVIRRHMYIGPCADCLNAAERKCYSCLGRCRNREIALEPTSAAHRVVTIGCWNNRLACSGEKSQATEGHP